MSIDYLINTITTQIKAKTAVTAVAPSSVNGLELAPELLLELELLLLLEPPLSKPESVAILDKLKFPMLITKKKINVKPNTNINLLLFINITYFCFKHCFVDNFIFKTHFLFILNI